VGGSPSPILNQCLEEAVGRLIELTQWMADTGEVVDAIEKAAHDLGEQAAETASAIERVLSGVRRHGAHLAEVRGQVVASGPIVSASDKADQVLDFAGLLGGSADTIDWAARLADASVQLREGVDINTLEWREETTALLNVGRLEAQRLTDQLAAQHPLTPEQAAQVRELLVKAFIRQAQTDGLLPERLEVLPSPAEGGDPSETIDVRDPMTGTSWDVSDSLGVVTSTSAPP
jgi:hypothetical protein